MGALICVDAGNSRIKWSILHSGVVLGQGSEATNSRRLAVPQQLVRLADLACISSVAGAERASHLRQALTELGVTAIRFLTSEGVRGRIRNGYKNPASLGVDRWLAMVAAEREFGLPIVVVDSGTALTVDGVDSSGQHLGGYIMPGMRTMLRALGDATAQIPVESLHSVVSGTTTVNTSEAVCAGVVEAARGLVQRAIQHLAAREGRRPQVVVTGGDRRTLVEPGSCWHIRPDLVLRGIHLVASDPRGEQIEARVEGPETSTSVLA